jgi:hypothetical protein
MRKNNENNAGNQKVLSIIQTIQWLFLTVEAAIGAVITRTKINNKNRKGEWV